MKTGTDTVDPDHNHIIKDTTAKVAITPTEAIPGHSIGTTDDITRVIHNTHTEVLICTILTTTPYIKDHLHTGAHQPTQNTTAYHSLGQPTNQCRKPCIKIHHIPEDSKVKHILKEIQESQ